MSIIKFHSLFGEEIVIRKLIPFIFMLLIVGLNGCIQNNGKQVDDGGTIQIVSFYVETYSEEGEKIDDGFVHNEESYWYLINGTVKNNLSRMTDIRINISFFDVNNTFLDSTYTRIYNVPANHEKTFNLKVHLDYFEKTEKLTFELMEI